MFNLMVFAADFCLDLKGHFIEFPDGDQITHHKEPI